MKQIFSNLKVRVKITLGFACVLAIFAIVSGSSVISLSQISGNFVTYTQRVEVAGQLEKIGLNIAILRRHVREFALTGDEVWR